MARARVRRGSMSYASGPLSAAAQVDHLVTSEKKRLGWLSGGLKCALSGLFTAGGRARKCLAEVCARVRGRRRSPRALAWVCRVHPGNGRCWAFRHGLGIISSNAWHRCKAFLTRRPFGPTWSDYCGSAGRPFPILLRLRAGGAGPLTWFDLPHILEDGDARVLIRSWLGIGRKGGCRHVLGCNVVCTHYGFDVENWDAVTSQAIP
ncbi:hypothetical protein SAMN04488690_0578 [Stenotrophomonas indicatrix]|uniref:Uncharacterized protein n=1 Tax=Stenotrophomonas indicatrix TaxID=2045451 RepID=A0A1W1GU64_9GAMM|nr:hypothetical protein SAMN04488690_0578 [Stenotrophomonas indicatrix]